MLFTKTLCRCLLAACLTIVATTLTACAWMDEGEDLAGCPTGDFVVQFVYDYNIQRSDMFRDQVGEVNLYVFDEAGNLVTQRTVNDREAISDRDNRFNITLRAANTPGAAELVAGRKYRFMAVAGQKAGAIVPTTDVLPVSGNALSQARYRQTHLAPGASIEDFRVALDRDATPEAYGRHLVSNAAPLDTLWHTLGVLPSGVKSSNTKAGWDETALVTIRPNITDSINVVAHQPEDTVTISLVRDTKHLHISLHELDAPGLVAHNDYEVFITDRNGIVDHKNNVLDDQPLVYRPYAEWTTDVSDAGGSGTMGQWDLMFNRLMLHKDAADDARLVVRRRSDGMDVANLSLPRILSYDNPYVYQQMYSVQDFLDRSHDYSLSFYLKNGSWESTEAYLSVKIGIVAWIIRCQDAVLK